MDPRLAGALSLPVAAAAIAGIAILPGYLNAHLVTSLLLDRPRPVEDDLPAPPVTVLIAADNESERIADTVRYVLASDYPDDLSVMVCDDGSSDGTAEIVAGLRPEPAGHGLRRGVGHGPQQPDESPGRDAVVGLLILSPVSLAGYVKELARARRRW